MSRSRLVAYWVTTCWVALGMVSGGVAHVLHVPASVDGFVRLGYPLHFVTLLGIWKILGALALLAPKFPRLKEWAYAGIVIDLTGAAFAWAVVGASDSVSNAGHIIAPLAGLVLTLTSWALRPDSRKLPGSLHKPLVLAT
ncbi:DoxX family protein [Polyangium sp. y55x31]|uniref:DoxX family protein n=1 Tax=Polyangium sp. y55x31 TaxID=3042688 RepID=UPI002482D2AA|nr:DoxX family protein [Polyangium sp. y55x31]MDI1482927.1 DoxX family protein [Polyangium sp. y55x31]